MDRPTPEFVAGWRAAHVAADRAMQDENGCLRGDMPTHVAADIDQHLTEGLGRIIEDSIDAWHNDVGGTTSLVEHLGWTWEQYAAWVKDPSQVPDA